MKTQQHFSGDFDEMIFEKRNKSYGAYMLRRQYGNRLLRALLSSAVLMALAVGGWAWQQHNSTLVDIPESGPILMEHPVDITPPKEPEKPAEAVKPVTPPPATAGVRGPKTPELGTPTVVQHADSVPPVNNLAGADPNGHKGGQGSGPEQPRHDSIPAGPVDPIPTGPVAFADQMPENAKLRPYLASSLRFPEIAKSEGISGTVVLSFVVDTTGNVQNLAVEKGVHPSLDKEALRVAAGMPKWIPAVFHGRKVSYYFHLPIKFSLH